LVITVIASSFQAVSRVIGSCATIVEGTRPVRHLGKPLRLVAYCLEAIQEGIEALNPNTTKIRICRRPRKFTSQGTFSVYEYEDEAARPLACKTPTGTFLYPFCQHLHHG